MNYPISNSIFAFQSKFQGIHYARIPFDDIMENFEEYVQPLYYDEGDGIQQTEFISQCVEITANMQTYNTVKAKLIGRPLINSTVS